MKKANPTFVTDEAIEQLRTAVEVNKAVVEANKHAVDQANASLNDAKSALEKMNPILAAAGTSSANIVKCTVFLVDAKDFGGMNKAYAEYFPKEPPARTTVVVAALVSPGAKLEVECIAAIPK